MTINTPIIIITNSGDIKQFNGNQIGDARLYIEENGGMIFWRDDWYRAQLYKKGELQNTLLEIRDLVEGKIE